MADSQDIYTTADMLGRMPSRDPMKDLHGYVADYLRKRDEVPNGALATALTEGPPKQPEPNILGKAMSYVPPEVMFLANFLGPKAPLPGLTSRLVDVYHGTTADVSGGVKPMARTKGQVPAISLATTEEQAAPFTYGINGKPTAGSSITKGQLDATGFRDVDWPAFASSERWNPNDWQRLLRDLQEAKIPGAYVSGMRDAGGAVPQYVVLDSSRFIQKAPVAAPTLASVLASPDQQ